VLDLNRVISDAGTLLQRLIGADVAMSCSLAPDLLPIKGHPGQIEQILVNLAVNARDAMPQGGTLAFETKNVSPPGSGEGRRAEDALMAGGAYVRLTVTDSGVGMDDHVKARLFEPFFTTKGPGQGTGLGLATINSIVSRSNGRIRVDSEPGAGTSFTIDFPAV
jgi:two-component system, cell cycle sensor histidine kinase and response regulator CckA